MNEEIRTFYLMGSNSEPVRKIGLRINQAKHIFHSSRTNVTVF